MVFSKDGRERDKKGGGDTRALSGVMIDDGKRSNNQLLFQTANRGR